MGAGIGAGVGAEATGEGSSTKSRLLAKGPSASLTATDSTACALEILEREERIAGLLTARTSESDFSSSDSSEPEVKSEPARRCAIVRYDRRVLRCATSHTLSESDSSSSSEDATSTSVSTADSEVGR